MIVKILYGYKMTQCLYVAAKLNVADYLAHGPKSIKELASLTDTKPDPLYRVMRCLASLGVFQEADGKTFLLNESAKELLSDSENTMKDFVILCGEELYQAAGQLLYTTKTGLPAFDHIYGMNHWAYLDANPEKALIFHDAMGKGTQPMIRKIISHYDFSPYKSIVDVGGGKGHLLCEILNANKEAQGIVYDLANAKASAEAYINELGLTNRCQFVTGNFFEAIPDNGDLYLLKVVLHDWDNDKAFSILKNCRKAMNKNSKLLIIEKIVEDNNLKDLACLSDINMLVTLSGKERSLIEFQEILAQTGFTLTRNINTGTVFSIIEALPKY